MTRQGWSDPGYATAAELVAARAGLCFPPNLRGDAERKIRESMEHAGIEEISRYIKAVETDRAVFDELIDRLTVAETYFFREPSHFDFVGREILPAIARLRGPGHAPRAWSAGCASGEEAYSLAIFFEERGIRVPSGILATDVSGRALAKARRGAYSGWSMRRVNADFVGRYFCRTKDQYVLADRVRQYVKFEYLNLALDVFPSLATGIQAMDLIFCRNVLIYLNPEVIRRVARRFFDALAPGGWLITASTDPPIGELAPYATTMTDAGVFYRRPERRAAASTPAPAPEPEPATLPTEVIEQAWPMPADEPAAAEPVPVEAERMWQPDPPAASPEARAREEDPLGEATAAFAQGDYQRAVNLLRGRLDEPEAAELYVRSLANLDTAAAQRDCAEAAARRRLSPELHYLNAVLLLELDRPEAAVRAARLAIYLDRSLEAAHFALGTALRRCGDLPGAIRAYRNVHDLCSRRDAGEILSLTDGERAGRLQEATAVQLELLQARREEAL